MATILKFDASERAAGCAQTPRRLRPRQSAEIVIFPGVRYEYWQEPEEEAQPQPGKRDVLEPAD